MHWGCLTNQKIGGESLPDFKKKSAKRLSMHFKRIQGYF
jgi:hypothetical protein